MMRYIKALSLSMGAICVLCAGVASAASAHLFEAESYFLTPPPAHGAEIRTLSASVNNGFEIAGATSVCKEATFHSTARGTLEEKEVGYTKAEEKVAVHPTYSKCFTQIGTAVSPTKVNVKSCEYSFTATAGTAPDFTGEVAIVKCPTGSPIEVEVLNEAETVKICTIKVNETGNGKLTEVGYENFGSGASRGVDVEADAEGITYEVEKCPEGVTAGKAGKYRLGSLTEVGGKVTAVKLLNAPVEAEVSAFEFEKGATKVGAWIK